MLTNDNVTLRLITENDLNLISDMRNEHEMYNYFYEYPISPDRQKIWFESHLKSEDLLFVIEGKAGGIIGTVGLSKINWRDRNAEFGRFFIFREDNREQGYGTDAVNLILEYAFNHLNLHRVYLDLLHNNKVAFKFYQKIGFYKEGLKKRTRF